MCNEGLNVMSRVIVVVVLVVVMLSVVWLRKDNSPISSVDANL
jgi:hypothetical protein